MDIRNAVEADAPMIARINQRLVEDEWGGGSMSMERFEERARRRIDDDEYRVLLFHDRGHDVAYALLTADEESAFIHHFYVMPEHRGDGVGREAMALLFRDIIPSTARVTLDVLASNTSGRAFWKSAGFSEYSVRMERQPTVLASDTSVLAAFDDGGAAGLPSRGQAFGDSVGQPGTADPPGRT